MQFAIVAVTAPTNRANQIQGGWPAFLSNVAALKPNATTQTHPAENVWLLKLPDDTLLFAEIVHAAKNFDIPHRVLYFSEMPKEYSSSINP